MIHPDTYDPHMGTMTRLVYSGSGEGTSVVNSFTNTVQDVRSGTEPRPSNNPPPGQMQHYKPQPKASRRPTVMVRTTVETRSRTIDGVVEKQTRFIREELHPTKGWKVKGKTPWAYVK